MFFSCKSIVRVLCNDAVVNTTCCENKKAIAYLACVRFYVKFLSDTSELYRQAQSLHR